MMLWLLRRFLPKTVPEKFKPTSQRIISSKDLKVILRSRFPDVGEIYLSDRLYLLCNTADISKFLQQDATNKYKYQDQFYDCDDFSYRLMGQFSIPLWSDLAFGIVWTRSHALNCFVTEDEKFYFIEPQNDKILEELKPWMGSKIRFIIM